MTRKDYEAIAAAMKTARDVVAKDRKELAGANIAINYITEVMAADNPRFDRARFLKACGLSV